MRSSDAGRENEKKNDIKVISEYSQTVCEQIRWKKARQLVEREIQDHICDQKDAYLASGMSEGEAAVKAVESMGDPIAVGMSLDRVHRPKPQRIMVILTVILMILGLAARCFGSSLIEAEHAEVPLYLAGTAAACFAFAFAYFIDFSWLGKYAWQIFAAAALLSIIVCFLSSRGVYFFRSQGWQSALAAPLAIALLLYALRGKGVIGIFLCEAGCFMLAAAFMPIWSENIVYRTGSSIALFLFASVSVILLCFAIFRGWFGVSKRAGALAVTLPAAAAIGVYLMYILADSSRTQRLLSMIRPEPDALGYGYWTVLIQDTMSNSSLFGTGSVIPAHYGAEDSALWGYDFILTALTHNYGWIIFFIAAAVFFVFIVSGLRLCLKQKSVLGGLVSMAVMLTLTMQIVIYFLCDLGIFFGQTLSLPLVSGGNAALIIDAALIGFMLSVFRNEEIYSDEKGRREGRRLPEETVR